MGLFDWLGKSEDKTGVDMEDLVDDDELDEWMEEMGLGEPDLQHKKMYAFVHLAIRDAVMLNHPELIEELNKVGKEPSIMPLLHFWSRAMMILEQMGEIDMDDEFDDENEWLPFDQIGIEQFSDNGYRISIVTLPKPCLSPEAYMVAIVHKEGDPLPYNGERGNARYFTLEYTGKGMAPVICEWDNEEHCNYGEGPQPDSKAFMEAVLTHC